MDSIYILYVLFDSYVLFMYQDTISQRDFSGTPCRQQAVPLFFDVKLFFVA